MGLRTVILVALIALGLGACGSAAPDRVAAAEFERNFVEVELTLSVRPDGTAELLGTFTPEPGWHLYDTDMSMDGIDGLGRPTRLELVSGAEPIGSVEASVEPYELAIPALETAVPVYPDGPVTLRSELTPTDGVVEVDVTYMACAADGGCRIPVVGHRVEIVLP